MRRGPVALGAVAVALGVLACAVPCELSAQTFRGRVVEDGGDLPISTALVHLLDEEGEHVAIAIADSGGFYRIQAPEPGVYRLEAARIGFETFRTPLLEARSAEGTYPIDLVLRTDPLHLPGFTVMTDRVSEEEVERQLRLVLGVHPASLRHRPIGADEIREHVEKGHTLVDLIRWQNLAGLVVHKTTDGPCFSARGRGCLPVYLNGFPLHSDFVEAAPLNMVYQIVVVTPTDPMTAYGGGAVLLFTEGWLR